MRLLGHVRKGDLKNLGLTGSIKGKRSMGRRVVERERGAEYLGVELLQRTKNKELWRSINSYFSRYGT